MGESKHFPLSFQLIRLTRNFSVVRECVADAWTRAKMWSRALTGGALDVVFALVPAARSSPCSRMDADGRRRERCPGYAPTVCALPVFIFLSALTPKTTIHGVRSSLLGRYTLLLRSFSLHARRIADTKPSRVYNE